MLKSKTIKFQKETTFLGRNGEFRCTGVTLFPFDGNVRIEPITSKGVIGRSRIEIPEESLPELIKELQSLNKDWFGNP